MMDNSKRTGAAIGEERIETEAFEPPVSPESLFGKIVRILKDRNNRAILAWLGGAAAVIAAGTWPVAAFVFDHKVAIKKLPISSIALTPQLIPYKNAGAAASAFIHGV